MGSADNSAKLSEPRILQMCVRFDWRKQLTKERPTYLFRGRPWCGTKEEANEEAPEVGQLALVPPRLNSSGLLYATIWSAESEFIGFMEGCVRAKPDHSPTIYLSSGAHTTSL